MRSVRTPRVLVACLALSVAGLAGCADGAEPAASPASTATSGAESSPPVDPASPTPVPGEPFDIGPAAGAVLAVVGVAHDAVLDVLAAPGEGQPVIATLGPLDDVVATGNHWLLEGVGIWNEIESGATTGWVDSSSLAWIGPTSDVTAAVITNLGTRPEAPTMLELGRVVADSFGPTEGDLPRVVLTVAPTEGDLGEVTYDVIGFQDDAVVGARLHVFGTPGAGMFSLKAVESTDLCGRGGSPTELCL